MSFLRRLLARFLGSGADRVTGVAASTGTYPPALAARWEEIRRRGPPQLALVDHLPDNASWVGYRDTSGDIRRLLIFASFGLCDSDLDRAFFHFYDDEFKHPDPGGRRRLLGFADASVVVRSDTGEHLLPADPAHEDWPRHHERVEQLMRALQVGTVQLDDIGTATLIRFEPELQPWSI